MTRHRGVRPCLSAKLLSTLVFLSTVYTEVQSSPQIVSLAGKPIVPDQTTSVTSPKAATHWRLSVDLATEKPWSGSCSLLVFAASSGDQKHVASAAQELQLPAGGTARVELTLPPHSISGCSQHSFTLVLGTKPAAEHKAATPAEQHHDPLAQGTPAPITATPPGVTPQASPFNSPPLSLAPPPSQTLTPGQSPATQSPPFPPLQAPLTPTPSPPATSPATLSPSAVQTPPQPPGIATPAPVQLPGGCLSGSGADCIKAAFFLDTGCTSNVGGQRLALPRVELNSSASVCNISSILQQHDQAAAASFSLQNGQCPAASQVTPADALSTRCGQQQCSGPNSTTAFRSVLLAPGATLYLLNSSSAQAPCASNNLLSGSSSVALRNTLAQPQCFSLGDLQGYPFQNTSFFSFVERLRQHLPLPRSPVPIKPPAPAPVDHLLLALQTAGPAPQPVLSPAAVPARGPTATPVPAPALAVEPPVPSLSAADIVQRSISARAPSPSANPPAPKVAAPAPAPAQLDRLVGTFSLGDLLEAAALTPAVATLAGTPAASAPSPSAAPPSPDLAAIIQRLIQSRAPTAAPPLQLPISLPPIPAPGSSDAAASPQPAASAPILAALLQKLSRPPSPSQAPSAALSPELAPLLPAATAPDLSASPAPAPDPALLGLAGSAPGPGPAASALVTQAPGLAPGPAPSADSLARAALLAALAGRLNNTNGAPGPAPAPAAAPKPLAVPAPAPLDAIVPARAPAASNVTQVPVSGPALAPAMARNPTLAPAVAPATPGERALAPAFGPQPSQTVPIIPFVPVFPSASERSVSGANQTLVAFTVAPTTTAFFINPTTGMLERVDPGSINATAANNIIVGSDTFGLRVFSQDPLNTLPKDALRVRGGSVDGTTPVGTAGREFEAQLRAAPATGTVPNRQVVVNANPGFQLGNGLTLNGEANQITVTVDDTPPQATITLKNAYQTDSVPDPAFLISFGKRVRAYDPTKLYTLTGTNRTDVAYNVDSGEIYVAAYVQDQAIGTTITVTVNDGVTTDVVGNRNRGATFSYQYKPTPQPSTAVAQTVNALGGGALALTTVMPFISSLGSAATPAATFAAQHLLSQGQIFYLASHMAVANLPQNFRDIGNTFSWTMLDIRAPWEAKDVGVGGQFPTTPMAVNTPVFGDPASTERFFALPQQGVAPAQPANGKAAPAPAAGGGGLARKLLQDHMSRFGRRLMQQNETLALPGLDSQRFVVTSTGLDKVSSSPDATVNNGGIGSLKALALGQGNSLYTSLYRALFWLGVGLVGITLLQAACISLLMYLRKKRPNILHFPRPQLFVLLVAAPAIAQGAAKLFSGSATDIIVGVILVVFLPVMFIILAIGFVYSAVYHRRSRKAVFVLEHDPILGQHSRHAHGHKGSVVLDVLFGRTLTSGTWQPAKRPESNFVPRWGALFEDNRGEPMVLTGATYAVDPVTGALNRGQLVPVPGKAIISIGRLRVHRHQLQAYANLFEALKVISLALLTNGISSSPNNNLAQVVAMLAIVTVYLLYLRFFKPIERRTELAIQIVSEVMSMFVFACGIVLIAKGHVSPRFRLNLGIAMLVAQAIAFLAYLLHILRLVWENVSGNVIPNLKFLPRSPAAKFAAVVRQVMQKDEHILARKYSDRWMIKVLKIGLFKRRPFRTELVDPRKALYRAVTLEAVTTKLRRGRSGEGSGLQGMSSGDFGSEVGSPKLWGLRSPKAGAIANGNGKLPKWPSVEMGAEGQHKEGAEATGMMRSNPILESLADEVINTPPAETSAASRRRSGFDGRPGSPVGVNPDLLKSSNPVFELDSDRRSASSASSSTRPPWRRPNAKVPPDEHPGVGAYKICHKPLAWQPLAWQPLAPVLADQPGR
ncbi:hypothetical protein WJX72_007977 [[Myrmecia] bisecta]|uniref:Uncharacterized protein n=1 Tax=[Myrmecia] bisecta TaxID=41462 RepID=A0AAW1PLQ8_9CHLO